jgi:hypothetical protein
MSGLDDNLLAYWTFEETAGSDRADSSGNSNTLAETGNTVAASTGKISNAAKLGDGSPLGYLSTTGFATRAGDWTVAGWFNPRIGTGSGQQRLISRDDDFYIDWRFDSERFYAAVKQSSGWNAVTTTGTGDVWHHVVVDHDATSNLLRIHVDGVLGSFSTVTGTNSITSDNITIGAAWAFETFDRSVDELGIWSRVLTDAEIAFLYNGGTGVTYPFPTLDAASATWTVPAPQRVGLVRPAAVQASWIVPAPSRVGSVRPAAVSATWTVPTPQRVGAVNVPAAVATWTIPTPALIGPEPNNVVKFGSESLTQSTFASEVLV